MSFLRFSSLKLFKILNQILTLALVSVVWCSVVWYGVDQLERLAISGTKHLVGVRPAVGRYQKLPSSWGPWRSVGAGGVP